MPPQYECTWGSTSLHPVPEDYTSMDVFNVFEDLNLFGGLSPSSNLFDDLMPEVDLPDLMESLTDLPSPLRHDCMWSGFCVDDNKDRVDLKERPNPEDRLQQESPVKSTERVKDYVHHTSVPQIKSSTNKVNQRSLLRTNHNLSTNVNDQLRTTPQEDSDDSGRPETPQSISSENSEGSENDSADFKHDVDFGSSFNDDSEDDDDKDDRLVEDDDDEDEDADVASGVNVSDVTGQLVRTSYYDSSEGLHRGRASRSDARPQQAMSNHFINDHSYYQGYACTKSDVSASIPGNLTPSDSEDEIDVVSVCGEKGAPSSRSSSQGGALPSNPSARERHAIQNTMASAMAFQGKKSTSSYPSYGRPPSGKLARMQAQRQAERQRHRERKRRAEERDESSEEDSVRLAPTKKRAKHAYKHVFKHAPKRGHSFKNSSSDSEPDSCEKRSLHNNMERQRRVDLRNAFEDLRVVVPTLSPNPRAAKVVILKEASHYCRQLTSESKGLQQEENALARERDRLMARVSYLRKQVASMRMGV